MKKLLIIFLLLVFTSLSFGMTIKIGGGYGLEIAQEHSTSDLISYGGIDINLGLLFNDGSVQFGIETGRLQCIGGDVLSAYSIPLLGIMQMNLGDGCEFKFW